MDERSFHTQMNLDYSKCLDEIEYVVHDSIIAYMYKSATGPGPTSPRVQMKPTWILQTGQLFLSNRSPATQISTEHTYFRHFRRQPCCFSTSQSSMTPRSPRSLLPRLNFRRLWLEVRSVERPQQQCDVRLQLSNLQERR